MAKLAIKGHHERGKEVIEILEMLGGKNIHRIDAIRDYYVYFVMDDKNKTISSLKLNQVLPEQFIIYSLEEFLEKFPYKVGDKVLYKIYGIYSKIKTMLWNVEKEQVFYRLDSNKLFVATADKLKPRKEEIIEDKLEQITFDIPNGYEFFGINDDNQVVLAKKQPQYPKTYIECCEILQVIHTEWYGYLEEVLVPFQTLLICRNAYWKIAGEEMGLDKPWEPDYTNYNEERYGMYTRANEIILDAYGGGDVNTVLTFPTEEMRDMFYENFKELIEQCKELL